MSNIIDKIQVSGVTYQIQGSGGGGVPESTFTAYTATTDERISQDEEVTAAGLNALNDKITATVELTQAEYDALVTAGTVAQDTYYIITDAQAGDLTNYYTKSETNTLLGGKQATLVSGTNIKTINNESILGSGNIDIQGGSTYTAGRGISIANDTISFSLPISAGTGENSIIIGRYDAGRTSTGKGSYSEGFAKTSSGQYSHAEGWNTYATANYAHAEGYYGRAKGEQSHAEGYDTTASGKTSHVEGTGTQTKNESEHASGHYNNSVSASTTFGDSGNTLFSVGNGTSNNARHNAFEIRQNGDIYLTKDGQDVKLQDQLGGSSITVDTALDSGSTNPVENRVIYNKIDEVEQVTAAALNELNDAVSGKQDTLVSGTNIKTINNTSILGSGNIDIQGGGGTVESAITSGSTNAVESKAIWSATTFNKGVLLTFDGNRDSTNYPEGCGKIKVENIGSYDSTFIYFRNDRGVLGYISIGNFGNISVDTSHFEGATYEISGTTVIISYPSNGITSVRVDTTSWTYTAVVEGAWVNENTYMKLEVDAIANGLQNNINSKLDATAYTPTVVDSALYAGSTNPVQNQVLYPELRIDNGESETTLTFDEYRESTNYPNGCTKLIVEVAGSNNNSTINFYNNNQYLGYIMIDNWGSISVNVRFDGASYEISGTTVIISYPTVTNVTKIEVNNYGNYVFKAIVALATSLKNQVLANTNKIDEVEQVTAAGLNALNNNFGGLKLVKLSQAEYNALATKDSSTLYIIVN